MGSDVPTRDELADRIEASRLSSWDYRVVRRTAPPGPFQPAEPDESFEVIEAYYDGQGNLEAWCAATPAGNSVQELYDDLRRMNDAVGRAFLKSPALAPIEYADLPGEHRE